MSTAFRKLLSPQRLTDVVDVGANPIDDEPPYTPMLAAGLCRVMGFEPQHEALLKLQGKKGPQECYLPYAVGDGDAHMLNICQGSGMTSLFEPDPAVLGLFEFLKPYAQVIERVLVQTRTLDDISEIQHIDFLKIDIQGGELAVFKGGKAKLTETVAIQTESSFVTLYKGQPGLGDIDLELRSQGFVPHCFAAIKRWPIAPFQGYPRHALNQLLEADIVYVRDFAHVDSMSDEQLKHLALIAHHCYQSFDLASRCVMLLEQRQALETGTQQRYLQILATSVPPA
jgi:FkbM family methyltransferase